MCEQEHQHEPNNCRTLLSSLSEYVDGELSPELCAALEQHITNCQKCRIVVDTLKKTVELYHDCSEEDSLPDDVRSRLFVRLNLEEFRKE